MFKLADDGKSVKLVWSRKNWTVSLALRCWSMAIFTVRDIKTGAGIASIGKQEKFNFQSEPSEIKAISFQMECSIVTASEAMLPW